MLYGTLGLMEIPKEGQTWKGGFSPRLRFKPCQKVQLQSTRWQKMISFAQARAVLQLLGMWERTFQGMSNLQSGNRYTDGNIVGQSTLYSHWKSHQRQNWGGDVYWRLTCILMSMWNQDLIHIEVVTITRLICKGESGHLDSLKVTQYLPMICVIK